MTPGRRILDLAVADASAFLALCQERGVPVLFTGLPEPAYTSERRATLYRSLSLPTLGAPNTAWPDGLELPTTA